MVADDDVENRSSVDNGGGRMGDNENWGDELVDDQCNGGGDELMIAECCRF